MEILIQNKSKVAHGFLTCHNNHGGNTQEPNTILDVDMQQSQLQTVVTVIGG